MIGDRDNPVVLTPMHWCVFGPYFFAGCWRLVTDGQHIHNLVDPHGKIVPQ